MVLVTKRSSSASLRGGSGFGGVCVGLLVCVGGLLSPPSHTESSTCQHEGVGGQAREGCGTLSPFLYPSLVVLGRVQAQSLQWPDMLRVKTASESPLPFSGRLTALLSSTNWRTDRFCLRKSSVHSFGPFIWFACPL